jgi:hypothetical protein
MLPVKTFKCEKADSQPTAKKRSKHVPRSGRCGPWAVLKLACRARALTSDNGAEPGCVLQLGAIDAIINADLAVSVRFRRGGGRSCGVLALGGKRLDDSGYVQFVVETSP